MPVKTGDSPTHYGGRFRPPLFFGARAGAGRKPALRSRPLGGQNHFRETAKQVGIGRLMAVPFGVFILGVAWLLATERYVALAAFVVAGVVAMLALSAWFLQRHTNRTERS